MDNGEIVSVTLIDGQIELIRRFKSKQRLMSYPSKPKPDKVQKEIYVAHNGEIILDRIEYGTHKPAKHIKESFEFKE